MKTIQAILQWLFWGWGGWIHQIDRKEQGTEMLQSKPDWARPRTQKKQMFSSIWL